MVGLLDYGCGGGLNHGYSNNSLTEQFNIFYVFKATLCNFPGYMLLLLKINSTVVKLKTLTCQ